MPSEQTAAIKPGPIRARDDLTDATDSGRARSATKSLAGTLGTTVGVLVVGVLTGALTARMLGVTGRGVVASVVVWASAIAYIGDLGGTVAYTYLVSRDRQTLVPLARNAWTLSAGQSLLLIPIGILLVSIGLKDDHTWLYAGMVFVALYVPMNLLTRYYMGLHQGLGDFRSFNMARIALTVPYAILVIGLFVAGSHSVLLILLATIIANICAMCVAFRGLLNRQVFHHKFRPELTKKTFAYGFRAHIGNLTPIDSLQLDLAIVAAFVGVREAGLYAVASAASNFVRTQGTAIGIVALPRIAEIETDHGKANRAGAFFRLGIVVNVLSAIAIAVLATWLVPLAYGTAFAPATGIIRILMIGIVAASLRQVLGDCLRGAGRPLAGTIAEISSWVAVIIGLSVFVPLLGVDGAAIGVSLSYGTALVVLFILASRAGMSMRAMLVPKREDLLVIQRLWTQAVGRVKVAAL
jgi:O-antigen/teichoic acid export membrane protein